MRVTPAPLRVKPALPGSVIRDPQTRQKLPDEGAVVPDTSFWRRRLRSGDVVLVKESPVPPPDRATPTGLEPVTPLTTRADSTTKEKKS